jgi:hypothetical protein
MCFSRPRKLTFCSCLLAIRNQSSFAPLQDPPRSLSPAQSQVFPYQCSKHSMAKDRVGVADPWTHWEAVDGIVNCQDIEGRFADARNFEKDSSTILFWVHAAWCNSCCCLQWRASTKVKKGKLERFSFQSSQLTSSTQQSVSCRVHPLIDIWSTCIYLNCACASQSQGRSSWSPANFFNWVRWSFCDDVLYRLISYCDKVWLCYIFGMFAMDWQTDVNMALLQHSSFGHLYLPHFAARILRMSAVASFF